mmetsp:Transcript_26443/g.74404  ORF Transcript_26443/g.74404 Transcript_26443/m.74404 type:complete len:362 (-) Transcript_26443:90-1175(-)
MSGLLCSSRAKLVAPTWVAGPAARSSPPLAALHGDSFNNRRLSCTTSAAVTAYIAASVSKASTRAGHLVFGGSLQHVWGSRSTPAVQLVRTQSQKPGIGDGLLDMLQGGPKLRRWYGEEDLLGVGVADREQGKDKQEPEDEGIPKDTVLVADADSPMGEQVVLQLILARQKVRVLVADPVAAKQAYGPYVDATRGHVSSLRGNREALREVSALVIPGQLGDSLQAAQEGAGVEQVVLLSSVGLQGGGLLSRLLGGEQRLLADEGREAAVRASGLPHIVVRAGAIRDAPRAPGSGLAITKDGIPEGEISREDVAKVLALCASTPLPGSADCAVLCVGQTALDTDWEADLLALVGSSSAMQTP